MKRLAIGCCALTMLAMPAPTSARGVGSAASARFDPAAPVWTRLRATADRAKAVSDTDATPSGKRAAWQVLYDAASVTRVGPGRDVHPLAGVALSRIGRIEDDANDAAAVATLGRSIAILRPYREFYAYDYASALAVLAPILSTRLGKSTEALQLLGDSSEWYDRYLADRPGRPTDSDLTGRASLTSTYGQVLTDLDRFADAVPFQRAGWETLSRLRGPFDVATNNAEWNYAFALFRAGQGDEAEKYARDTVQVAVDHIDPKDQGFARALDALALLLIRRGKRHEALDYVRRSVEIRRAALGTNDPHYFSSVYNLGDVLTALERYDEADRALLEAANGWRRTDGEQSSKAAIARARAGLVEYADGRTAEALGNLTAALTAARASEPGERKVGPMSLPVMSLAHHDLGRSDDARRLADQGVTEAHAVAQPYPINGAVAELVAAYVKAEPGGSEDARTAARRVIEIERSNRDIAASGELIQTDRTALEVALRVATTMNDAQLALDAMVILTGSKIAQANRLVADRLLTADPVLAARTREQQDAARAFKTADSALLKALATGIALADARRVRDDAAAKLAVIRTALAHDFPNWAEASGVADPDLAQVQRNLGRQEAIVAIVPALDGVYTLTVTRGGAQVRRAPLGRKAIVGLIGRLRLSLPASAFDTAAAHDLYRQLFPAADAGLLRGITSLRIVPAGVFAALPFDTLLERPVDRLAANSPFLIRRFAITVAPGFDPLPARTGLMTNEARFLGIGAPTRFGTAAAPRQLAARAYFRGGSGDASALAGLPALPGSASELSLVARGFGPARARLLIGDDASEARLKALDLKPYTTILFATHGLVSGEVEGVTEPALVLARPGAAGGDGLLTASEVAALKLDADWVILSACNTAAGDGVEAPAYSGLAQAFRYAGARTLLLSHWPIRDDAAAFVTVQTIANARRGMRRDVALQRAMLKLIASRSIPGAADPYIWAPYILLGDTGG